MPAAAASSVLTKVKQSAVNSEQKWLADLSELLLQAKSRFADVTWVADDGSLVHGHKCIVYARAAGGFQQRYLSTSVPHNESSRSLPYQPYATSQRSLLETSQDWHEQGQFKRGSSPNGSLASNNTVLGPRREIRVDLQGTDVGTFSGYLTALYTGKGTEVFEVLFEGFDENGQVTKQQDSIASIERLRQDLLYCWRSKLFADVALVLDDGSNTMFASHRAILASRSPYFHSLLLGNYQDSNQTEFLLPSPPFTPASTIFCLGYIYSGTLEFGQRTFDLSTAFDLWRCGAYISMDQLQEAVEDKIVEMLNVKRAARVFNFSYAPDVNNQRLRRAAESYIVGHFGETWGCAQIGNLDYAAQRKLVADVCQTITPISLTAIGKSTYSLQKRMELERAPWSGHIISMLDAVEEDLRKVTSKNLGSIVVSAGFVDLIDGVGFSTDVLEWLLELAVGGLTDSNAPEAYQALVGSVLLREEGITMDAKVLVEDAKNGILKYIKRKWNGVRAARGFENLEGWCLKEISDEIEVSIEELQAASGKLGTMTSRTGLRVTPKKSAGSLLDDTNRKTASTVRAIPPTSAAAARPNASRPTVAQAFASSSRSITTQNSTPAVGTSRLVGTRTAPSQPSTTASRISATAATVSATRVGRATTTSSASTSSRIVAPNGNGTNSTRDRVGSQIGATTTSRRAPPLVPLATSRPPGTNDPRPASALLPIPAPLPLPPPSPVLTTSAEFSSPPISTSALPSPPSSSRKPSLTTPPLASTSNPSASSLAPPTKLMAAPTIHTRAKTTSNASGTSTRPPVLASRRPPSLAPSIVSQRSGAPLRPTNTPLASSSTIRTPLQSRTTLESTTPNSMTRARNLSTTSSIASTKGKERELKSPALSGAPSLGLRRPSSVTSSRTLHGASTRLEQASTKTPNGKAASIISIKSTRSRIVPSAVITDPTTPKVASKSPRSLSSPTSITPRAVVKSAVQLTPKVLPKPPARSPSLPRVSPLSGRLPGATLLSPIPCIVTVIGDGDVAVKFKAAVKYIGGVFWGEGQWVGVEAMENTIPDEAQDLDWTDGEVDGVVYFALTPESTLSKNTSRATSASGNHSDSAAGSVSSLRPPSRRQRRSSSTDVSADGVRRGLFVRPNQIVYVL